MRSSGGGQRSSGGVARVGAVRPHGAVLPISSTATRVLAACCTVIDPDGTICATVADLAERTGRGRNTVKRALDQLAAAGLVHRSGRSRGRYRYVDAQVLEALRVPTGRRTDHIGWRQLRARCGGFERAYLAARRRAEAAERRLIERPSAPVDASVDVDAWLRAEALHAIACLDGAEGCDRCCQLRATLLEGDSAEVVLAAADRAAEADELKAAAARLVSLLRSSTVGAVDARARAVDELERLVR